MTKGGRAQNKNPEYLPSPMAERVTPKIDDALKEKIAKATKPKGEAGKRGVSIWDIEENFFDNDWNIRQLHTFNYRGTVKGTLPIANMNHKVTTTTSHYHSVMNYSHKRIPLMSISRSNILPLTSGRLFKLIRFTKYIL